MTKTFETRLAVEDFVYREADLMDRWLLEDWLALWDSPCTYELTTTGEKDPEFTSPDNNLFMIADNRFRLEQRVARLGKPTAHAEWPHSTTRHLFGNVIVRKDDGDAIEAQTSFITYRIKRNITNTYSGHSLYKLRRSGDGFLITHKRVILDAAGLTPQGKVSIIM